jgi:hypothetical protein
VAKVRDSLTLPVLNIVVVVVVVVVRGLSRWEWMPVAVAVRE